MKNLILTALIAISGILEINAQSPLRLKQFNLEKDVAIQGYDPIAYLTQQKAVKGTKQLSATFEGVTYYFSSQSNKDLFLKDPKKFEPAYGGWCAYAMGANNEKVEIDPETFKIFNGKLYLFYHKWGNNTLTKWNADEANLRAKADKNWSTLFK